MSRLAYAFDRGSARARAAYALRKALAAMRAAPFTHVVAAASVAAALSICTVVGAATLGARALVEAWSRSGEITVYLAPGTSAKEAERLAAVARETSGGTVRYVSPEDALASLAASMGEAGQGLLDLPDNPLSGTLEIDLGSRPPEEIRAIVGKLAALSSVEEVDGGAAWTDRMARVARAAEGISGTLLPLLLLGAAVLVGSVVRLGVHERRKEITILRLVGATDGFIRAPLWIEGALSGLAGGLLAAAGVVGVGLGAGRSLAHALSIPPALDPAALLHPLLLGAVVLAGGVVGVVATALSVERQLR